MVPTPILYYSLYRTQPDRYFMKWNDITTSKIPTDFETIAALYGKNDGRRIARHVKIYYKGMIVSETDDGKKLSHWQEIGPMPPTQYDKS